MAREGFGELARRLLGAMTKPVFGAGSRTSKKGGV